MTGVTRRASIRRWTLSGLLVLTGVVLLVVLGCSTEQLGSKPAMSKIVPAAFEKTTTVAEKPIDYADLDGFDRSLSSNLRGTPTDVTVKFVAPTTVNEIPTRMDKWLSVVEKNGGKVQAAPDPEIAVASRGLITDVVSLAVGAYNLAKEKILYGPSKEYNAMVYYEPGTGRITRVVFRRKTEGPAN